MLHEKTPSKKEQCVKRVKIPNFLSLETILYFSFNKLAKIEKCKKGKKIKFGLERSPTGISASLLTPREKERKVFEASPLSHTQAQMTNKSADF